MKITVLVLLLSIIGTTCVAQDGYADGYYIPYGGDSIFTQIKVLNSKVSKKIGYINQKGKKKRFNADEVIEYGFTGLSSYASIAPISKAPKVRFFAEIVEDGQVRLMYYAFKKKYFIQKKGSGEAIKIKKMSFRKLTMNFFQDFDEVYLDIKKRRLKYGQLEMAVLRYNSWHQEYYQPYQRSLERNNK